MSVFTRWARHPQTIWLRRAVLQIHLWLGIGLGLYLFMISITGSIIVPRREITRFYSPDSVPFAGAPLGKEAILDAVRRAYPGFEVTSLTRMSRVPSSFRRRAGDESSKVQSTLQVILTRGQDVRERIFDPYSGRDLGAIWPWQLKVLTWIVDLHNNLLGGRTGRALNGLAGIMVTFLALTGAVVWWPGARRWTQSLTVRAGVGRRPVVWQLHSALGFWLLLPVLLLATSGTYFAFPAPFEWLVARIASPDSSVTSSGEEFLAGFASLHFGRMGGAWVRVTWMIAGLLPAILLVTGTIMWWNRVFRPWLNRRRKTRSAPDLRRPMRPQPVRRSRTSRASH